MLDFIHFLSPKQNLSVDTEFHLSPPFQAIGDSEVSTAPN
jgi:hypothetical protein